jgi:cytochrome c
MSDTRRNGLAVLTTSIVLAVAVVAAAGRQQSPTPPPASFGIGRAATAGEIAARDIDVGPDGVGLPPGRGTPNDGAILYQARCASCHGATGTEGPNDVLVARANDGFPFARNPKLPRAIGNYWPYATTLFDYIRRAMPPNAPGSLTNEEVYALVAHLLAQNGLVGADAVIDAQSLPKVHMPARDRFVPDARGVGKPPRP